MMKEICPTCITISKRKHRQIKALLRSGNKQFYLTPLKLTYLIRIILLLDIRFFLTVLRRMLQLINVLAHSGVCKSIAFIYMIFPYVTLEHALLAHTHTYFLANCSADNRG